MIYKLSDFNCDWWWLVIDELEIVERFQRFAHMLNVCITLSVQILSESVQYEQSIFRSRILKPKNENIFKIWHLNFCPSKWSVLAKRVCPFQAGWNKGSLIQKLHYIISLFQNRSGGHHEFILFLSKKS